MITNKNLLPKSVSNILFAVPLGITVVLGCLNSAFAGTIGAAADFNVFVFGDMNQSSDSEGRVAVGGNATFTNFGIADRLGSDAGTLPRLVVGGDLTYKGGQVFGGNAVYGGTGTISAGITGGSFTQGSSPIDFVATKKELSKTSADLDTLAATGTTTYHAWGGIELQGSQSGVNVFTLDGAKFSKTNNFVLKAPAGSTVIVNVKGDKISLQNFEMQFQGVSKTNVLFNFVGATELSSTNFSFKGSVLAPKADYKFNNGNLEGTLIANSVAGTGEFHHYPFAGNLPDFAPATEPESPAGNPPVEPTPPGEQPPAGNPPGGTDPAAEKPPTPKPTPTEEPVDVPEPATMLGTVLGGIALGWWRRKHTGEK